MKYRQVKQKSRIYEYGPGKEFETKQEVIKEIEKLERSLKTDLALKQIYQISEVKCIDVENALQLVLTIKIPILLEQEE